MFSDKILEKIFSNPEIQKIPFEYQSTMLHAIETAIEETEVEDDAISKHES